MNASFERLIQQGGGYSLPYLIRLHSEDGEFSMCFVNDVSDVEYDGETYSAGSFSYVPNASESGFDGGGKLEITVHGNTVINLVETKRTVFLEVTGVINDDGEIEPVATFRHHYGSVSVDRSKASFTFEKDDRLSMSFPSMIFSTSNNRGNS